MIIDVHCHVDLYEKPEEIVERAKKAGVWRIIAVSMDTNSMWRTLSIAEGFESVVKPALGVHPLAVQLNFSVERDLEEALSLMRRKSDKVVAVGEVGLDSYQSKVGELQLKQEEVFRAMLDFAVEKQLPVIVHSFRAERKTFSILGEYGDLTAIIHWFTGPSELLEEGIKKGYYFSVTPAITYSAKVRRVARRVPLELLFCESDGPVEYRGVIGEPANCRMVIKNIADVKGLEISRVEEALLENVKRVFKRVNCT
ncbi:MAG: TatD family hydrolase [Candidatus Jordarchaeales archaeon]|nr:TatD family hydrolase [Candidatus Jordarchaeia archaeon]